MGTLILLTTEAAEKGFGLNFDILETNIINLAIVISLLVYFIRGFLGKTLSERRSAIEAAIQEAEQRVKAGAAALAEQQQKLDAAKAEAAKILADAETSAAAAREAILAQAVQDVERMRSTAAQELNSQQERVVNELRQLIAARAVQQVESQLKSGLDGDTQQRLIDRSIQMIGGR